MNLVMGLRTQTLEHRAGLCKMKNTTLCKGHAMESAYPEKEKCNIKELLEERAETI